MNVIKLNGKKLRLHFNDEWHFDGFNEVKSQYEAHLAKWNSLLTYDSIRAKPYEIVYNDLAVDVFTGPFLYSQTRALQDTMVEIKNTELFNQLEGKAFNSISLTVAVVSSDGKTLIGLRSNRVHTYKNYWAVGIAEGLEAKDFQASNIDFAIQRGLAEEINVHLTENIPSYNLSLIEDEEKFSSSLFSVVDFRGWGEQYSSQAILEKAQLAEDSWEHEKIMFIEPTLEAFYHETKGNPLIAYAADYFEMVANYLKS
jgi:hypothetical protein